MDRRNPSLNQYHPVKKTVILWGITIIFAITVFKIWHGYTMGVVHPTYSQFYREVEARKIVRAQLFGNKIRGTYIHDYLNGKNFVVLIPVQDKDIYPLLRTNVENFRVKFGNPLLFSIFLSVLPIVAVVGVVWLIISRRVGGIGRKALHFGKLRSRFILPSHEHVTFADAAGVPEAKEELEEIVEFLKDPRRFQKLGGRIPKGVLLMGPPGTGKTLLAKAIAGEADAPFFNISGSDFIELFAGVGALRVRTMFARAKRHAPCIIFMDEIDAIGRYRAPGLTMSYEEREQTLNALLVEMDGFNTQEGVIIIAATNRPDVLDPALLRPGRFDRQVVLDLPDIRGRLDILKVHTKKITLSPEAALEKIAQGTAGFSGADLANLVNEAALLSARMNKPAVDLTALEEARDKVKWGRERRSRLMDDDDRKIAAYHEAGHALVLHFSPRMKQLHKVTIIPRGVSYLGATFQLPEKDRYTKTKQQIYAEITALMGGRVAEEIIFGDISTGATTDIEHATALARKMVCEWGMSDTIGPVLHAERDIQKFLGTEVSRSLNCSETVASQIDTEIKNIILSCYTQAKEMLTAHKKILIKIADELLKKEVLEACEVEELIESHAGETKGKQPAHA